MLALVDCEIDRRDQRHHATPQRGAFWRFIIVRLIFGVRHYGAAVVARAIAKRALSTTVRKMRQHFLRAVALAIARDAFLGEVRFQDHVIRRGLDGYELGPLGLNWSLADFAIVRLIEGFEFQSRWQWCAGQVDRRSKPFGRVPVILPSTSVKVSVVSGRHDVPAVRELVQAPARTHGSRDHAPRGQRELAAAGT